MNRILTTHAGSLIRPKDLLSYVALKETGRPYDEPAYEECLRRSVAGIVDHQLDVGIDVIDDGEMGKGSWIHYLYDRIGGIEARS